MESRLRPRRNGRAVVGSSATTPVDLTNDADNNVSNQTARTRTKVTNNSTAMKRTAIKKKPAAKSKAKLRPKPQVQLRMCIMCSDFLPIENFPMEKVSTGCVDHVKSCCHACMMRWVTSEFERQGVNHTRCPQCGSLMGLEDIKLHADRDTYDRYESLTLRLAAAETPDHQFCQTPDCTGGHVHKDIHSPFACDTCKKESCVSCGGAWHEGKTCKQHQAALKKKNKDMGKDTEQTFKKLMVKICPGNRCATRVEKMDGCDHMSCWKCGTEFCWVCLATANGVPAHHLNHDPACPNYQGHIDGQGGFHGPH